MPGFSTHLLDEALARKRREREELRQRVLTESFLALEELSQEIPFSEAYLFGSVAKPHKFREDSDVDVAFLGLPDEHFFRAMAFLSARLGRDVDLGYRELLLRMAVAFPDVRPALISRETLFLLDALWAFRYLFRRVYTYALDPQKVRMVLEDALALRPKFQADLEGFFRVLEGE